MRILVVTPALPHLPSREPARLAPAHLLEHLTARHTIGVVAAAMPGDAPAARAWVTARASWFATVPAHRWRRPLSASPADGLELLAAAVRRACAEFRPDVVHLESALLAPLGRRVRGPCVLACHEAAAIRGRLTVPASGAPWARVRARLAARAEAAWERAWLGGVTACVVDAEEHRRAIAAHVPFERIDVIPTGIDAEQYGYRRAGEPGRVVFTGHLGTAGDLAAARRLATSILPLLRRRIARPELLVASVERAGPARTLTTHDGVRVAASVGDLRPSLWSAAAYASPSAAGPGRKARLLEALAAGTPVVASPASLSGLADVLPGHHALAADTDGDVADALALLMREPVVANTIARNARELVEQRFTWRAIAERYEALYERLLATTAEAAA
jgi:glycosyltransferase involved in cell wall biosynthesis